MSVRYLFADIRKKGYGFGGEDFWKGHQKPVVGCRMQKREGFGKSIFQELKMNVALAREVCLILQKGSSDGNLCAH